MSEMRVKLLNAARTMSEIMEEISTDLLPSVLDSKLSRDVEHLTTEFHSNVVRLVNAADKQEDPFLGRVILSFLSARMSLMQHHIFHDNLALGVSSLRKEMRKYKNLPQEARIIRDESIKYMQLVVDKHSNQSAYAAYANAFCILLMAMTPGNLPVSNPEICQWVLDLYEREFGDMRRACATFEQETEDVLSNIMSNYQQ